MILCYAKMVKARVLSLAGWVIGASALLGGVYQLFSSPTEALFLLALGAIVFPPASNLITRAPQSKTIKILIGLVLLGSIAYSAYQEYAPSPEKVQDSAKKTNVNLIKQMAKQYCLEKGECPSSLDELFAGGHTAPFSS